MRATHWIFLYRLATLVALAVSMALLVDYVSPTASFCSEGGSCAAVKASPFSHLFGFLPVPVVGVAVFVAAFLLSMSQNRKWVGRLLPAMALCIGTGGLFFLLIQAFWLGRFCAYCVVVDSASLLICASGIALSKHGFFEQDLSRKPQDSLIDVDLSSLGGGANSVVGVWDEDSRLYVPPTPLVRPAPASPFYLNWMSWYLLLLLSIAAPLGHWALVQKTPLPPAISAIYTSEKLNVVEFFDFQCPHCRDLYPRLQAAKAPYGEAVLLQRRYVPLLGHPLSREASKVALCAAAEGKEEAAVAAYFSLTAWSEESVEEVARELLLNPAALATCRASAATEARLAEDRSLLERSAKVGLPTTYIGSTVLFGAKEQSELDAAFERAERGDEGGGLSGWFYWALIALAVFLIGFYGRARSQVTRLSADAQLTQQ